MARVRPAVPRRAAPPRSTAVGRRSVVDRSRRRSGTRVPPSWDRAAASQSGPSCGEGTAASDTVTVAFDGSPGHRRTACCQRVASPAPIETATKYHSQRRMGWPVVMPVGHVGRVPCRSTSDHELECPGLVESDREPTAMERVAPGQDGLLATSRERRADERGEREAAGRLRVVERDLRVRAAADVVVLPLPLCVDGGRNHDLLEPRAVGVGVTVDEAHEASPVSRVIGADHEPDRVAGRRGQPVAVPDERQRDAIGVAHRRRARATAASNAFTNPWACSTSRDGWIESRMNGLPRIVP